MGGVLGMLDLKALLAKILSAFVIKSSGSWRYVILGRWFIGGYASTGSLTIATAVGNVYQSATNSQITLPVTLTNNVYSNVTISTTSYGVWSYMVSRGNVLSYRAMSAISRSSAQYNITAITIGII